MSDCANGGRGVYARPDGHGTLRLRIEFHGGEKPWEYPVALNGRHVRAVYVGGERYVPARARDWDGEDE